MSSPHDDLKTLQDDVVVAHNMELTKEDHVTTFWADGEITSEKGGELYGLRSTFITGIAVTKHPLLQLPIPGSSMTSAIVTDKQATVFRERLKHLLYRDRPDIPAHYHMIASNLQDAYDGKTRYVFEEVKTSKRKDAPGSEVEPESKKAETTATTKETND